MKRTRLVRRTRLSPGSKPLRRTPMKRGRIKPAVPDDVRATLAERSGGWCEMRLPGCWGRATDPHHRITSKNGGRHGEAKVRHDRLSDLVHACRRCHERATGHGLSLEEWQDPSAEPVRLLAHAPDPIYLDDRGGWHTYEAVGS